MQDLRLVGVHDDGEHLLLSGTGGGMFRLPIDETLRAAASRSAVKGKMNAGPAPAAMSPRDIQARIRSGATAAEVAEICGMPLAKVQRYEGPVLAEREYVAQQARKVEVASPSPGHDVYRSAFGDNPASLGEMVAHRLSAHGIDASTVEWDSWRRTDGTWTVVARFEANPDRHSSIGEEPPAMWTFNPSRKSIQNANRWAQQLSELEPLDGPVPARRLAAVSDRPFDFEADADAAAPRGAGQQAKDPDGLLDMLRSRRGQRLGVDEDSDDALAVLLANGVPAAHPRPSDEPEDAGSGAAEPPVPDVEHPAPAAHQPEPPLRQRDGRPSILSRLSLAPRHPGEDDDRLKLHDGVSTDTREVTIVPAPLRPVAPLSASRQPEHPAGRDVKDSDVKDTASKQAGDRDAGAREPRVDGDNAAAAGNNTGNASNVGLDELLGGGSPRRGRDHNLNQRSRNARGAMDNDAHEGSDLDAGQPERQPSRPKRSSVPSWDEIVFGTRGD